MTPTTASAKNEELHEAAKAFYNATVADADVRITSTSEAKHDIATAASERLRAALQQRQAPAQACVRIDWPACNEVCDEGGKSATCRCDAAVKSMSHQAEAALVASMETNQHGISNEKHARADDQGTAKDEGYDSDATGGSREPGENQHNEHRESEPGGDGRTSSEVGRGTGLSDRGEVRAPVKKKSTHPVEKFAANRWRNP